MFTFVLAILFVESCFDHNSILNYDERLAIEIKNNLASFFFPPSTWKGKKCKYNLLQLFRDYVYYRIEDRTRENGGNRAYVYYCSSLSLSPVIKLIAMECLL